MFEQVIRQYVSLKQIPTKKGWYTCKCRVCDDYKVRAGFRFSEQGFEYHCFNCPLHTGINFSESPHISGKALEVLQRFSIPQHEIDTFYLKALQAHPSATPKTVDPDTILVPIALPKIFRPLDFQHPKQRDITAIKYLHGRKVDLSTYNFFVLDEAIKNQELIEKWGTFVIIPIYKGSSVVWYFGRNTDPTSKKRYNNAQLENEHIIYGYEQIYNSTEPLYVTEGFFDAIVISGVAVFGNTISTGQRKVINSCNRPKIYIPDIYGSGYIAAKQALQMGWSISIPAIGACKDINSAVVKYGLLYTLDAINRGTCSGMEADIKLAMMKAADNVSKKQKSHNKTR